MDKPLASIRITRPAFIEGRGIDAFAFQFIVMRQLFNEFSATLFPAPASSHRRR